MGVFPLPPRHQEGTQENTSSGAEAGPATYPGWESTLTPSSKFASGSELLPKAEGQSPAQGDFGLETGSASSTADAEDTSLGIFGFAK